MLRCQWVTDKRRSGLNRGLMGALGWRFEGVVCWLRCGATSQTH